MGPAGVDLGSLRCDAATSSGPGPPPRCLAGYEERAGAARRRRRLLGRRRRALHAAEVDWFTDAVRDQGRTDLDQPTLLRRRDAFLRAALDRLV